MTPRLVLRPQAEAEVLDARDWYEDQRPGLGDAFVMEVDRTLSAIVQAPIAYPQVRSSFLASSMLDGTLDAGTRGAESRRVFPLE